MDEMWGNQAVVASGLEKPLKVAGAVNHAQDNDFSFEHSIEDQVVRESPDCHAANAAEPDGFEFAR